jgi:hypothetical protein
VSGYSVPPDYEPDSPEWHIWSRVYAGAVTCEVLVGRPVDKATIARATAKADAAVSGFLDRLCGVRRDDPGPAVATERGVVG